MRVTTTVMNGCLAGHRWIHIALALAGLAAAGCVEAAVCRVAADGLPGADGASWAAPMGLPDALAAPACNEIWIRAGLYVPVTPADPASVTAAEREASFSIRPGVAVYGGFAGNETSRYARAPERHLVILSGDLAADDLTDPDHVTRDSQSIRGANSRHVVTLDGTGGTPVLPDTVLDGVTITGGNSREEVGYGTTDWGGGLLCDARGAGSECSPRVAGVSFRGNAALEHGGGAAFIADDHGRSQPVLARLRFIGNEATWGGGGGLFALATQGGSVSLELADGEFTGNRAAYGGGLGGRANTDGSLTAILSRASFIGNGEPDDHNVVTEGGGGIALFCAFAACDMQISNASFIDNTHEAGGGVFVLAQSADGQMGVINVTVRNATFTGNSVYFEGGGLRMSKNPLTSLHLHNVIAWGNSAQGDGAQIWVGYGAGIAAADSSLIEGGCPERIDCSRLFTGAPLLGPLQDNGGFAPTRLPGAVGSAIDNADPVACPAVDQRGVVRPQGWGCDIGAVELAEPASMIAVHGSGQVAALWHDFADPLAVQVLGPTGQAAPGLRVRPLAFAPGAGAECGEGLTNATGFAYLHCHANGSSGAYEVAVEVVDFPDVAPAFFELENVDDGDTIFRDDFELPETAGAAVRSPEQAD